MTKIATRIKHVKETVASACARVDLKAGKHTLRWTNDEGPGLNIDAMAFTDDAAWKPSGTSLKVPAPLKGILTS